MSVATDIANLMIAPLRRVSIEDVIKKATQQHVDDFVEANKEQLQEGENSDGQQITPFYTPFTVEMKEIKGQPSDRVTLKDTGDFYSGFYGDVSNTGTTLSSHDDKTDDLEGKYGPRIFGLTVASKEEVGARMIPTIQKLFKKALK